MPRRRRSTASRTIPNVTEDLPLEPLTDYSKYKAMCEEVLDEEREPGFAAVTLRPATVCGYAPRLRLDLTVNILTNHAINNGRITVFGGDQLRPNIHVEDMTDLYVAARTARRGDQRQDLECRLSQSQGPHYRRYGARTKSDQGRHRRHADAMIIAPIMFHRRRFAASSASSPRARFKMRSSI